MSIIEVLSSLGFRDTRKIINRFSISDIFKGKDKCGVFILHFPGDTYYIGKSENIPKSFLNIRIDNDDVTHISFKAVSRGLLDIEKQAAIDEFEKHFTIRNIAQASRPEVANDLDVIFPVEKQKLWLMENKCLVNYHERAENNTLREKYERRFFDLVEDIFFNERILAVLVKYVSLCIPEPYRTEISFWGCSCLPGGHSNPKELEVYSRIDLYWQEVFTVGQFLETKQPFFSWHLSKSKILGLSKNRFIETYAHITTMKVDDHYYPKGGEDQFHVTVTSTEDALELLNDKLFVDSVKEFNLRNMKRGSHIYASNHCMDLADLLLPDYSQDIPANL